MSVVFSIIVTFLIVYFLMPPIRKIAIKKGFVDMPTKRKKHKKPTPLIGGMAIFIGFSVSYIIFCGINFKNMIILLSSFMIFFIGFVDDYYKTKGKEFSIIPRLVIQITSCILVYFAGVKFMGFTNPFTDKYILLPSLVQFLLSILWLLGVTTVINWSDGMDGLAGSLCSISSITLLIVSLYKGQMNSAILCAILIGGVLAFLKYNKYPAEVFMGDSGANFLGFILGVIALDGAFKGATVVSIFIPILTLGVPIFDNIAVIIRRAKKGTPIYKADSTQIHHRLLSNGMTENQVVARICILSSILSVLSLVILMLKL